MTDSMFMNSNSSNESNSDNEKCRLSRKDFNCINKNDEQILIKQQQLTRKVSSIRKSLLNHQRRSFNETINGNNISTNWQTNGYHEDQPIRNINEDTPLEKTGWLHIKHWLTVQNYEQIQVISKDQWKRFWVWLKDSNLRLYNDYLDINPHLTINIIDCLCYPLPEQQKQYVFSLTIQTGDTYCFQSADQLDLDHWISCIHRNCLEELNKTILISHIKQLENDLIYENKILKLAELQLKLTTNNKTRLIITKQIDLLEKNLEHIHMDKFRKKCYLSSFNNQENLPNPKDLLSHISSTTKTLLYNLHAFTPCALYASIISRQRTKHQKSTSDHPINPPDSIEINEPILQTVLFGSNPQRKIIVSINETTTVGELLKRVTDKLNFDIYDYFLYFHSTSNNGFIPNINDKLQRLTYSTVEVCQKLIYQIILNNPLNQSGIEINYKHSLSRIFVSYVNKGSGGERIGVIKGDEIIRINNFPVQELDSMKFNRYLNQIPIMLTFRSSRLSQTTTNATLKNSKEKNSSSPMSLKTRFSRPILSNQNNEQQLQKVIFELIQTETSYVQDIESLIKQYIEPLRSHPTILPSDAIESLSNSIKSIHQLQTKFLRNLQFNLLTQNVVISLAETFINFSKDFKIYSTYCSIHLRLTRLLNQSKTNEYLKDFLNSCNPSHQHSLSFESYLIKPVQRVLKYPLFLQQLYIYLNSNQFNEIYYIKKSIKIINKISKYINSMQQLYEEFGQSFEYFKEKSNQLIELNLPELYAYGEIQWINIYRFISKKTYQDLKTFCFVFRNGCLLLVREQNNKKNQELLSNNQMNKNLSDCFIQFLPMKELQVELINDGNKDNNHHHTWQLIQINPKTQLKTYFRFANKDAQTFVKTISNCIIELLNPLSSNGHQQQSITCYDSIPYGLISNGHSEKKNLFNCRRSPSPIWKRRPASIRKRPSSMPNNKNFR